MVKVSKTKHIRKKGPGKGKLRKNPKRGKFGKKKKQRVFKTTYIQDKKTGLLQGRKYVPGRGDGTIIVREAGAGRIIGRVEKQKVKYE